MTLETYGFLLKDPQHLAKRIAQAFVTYALSVCASWRLN
jgi:hypothetical protein